MEPLIVMRQLAGFPFRVNSGFRCLHHDREIGGGGSHTHGIAIDLSTSGIRAYRILDLALECEMQGIGIHQNGPFQGRFIHLDMMHNDAKYPRPRIWTY